MEVKERCNISPTTTIHLIHDDDREFSEMTSSMNSDASNDMDLVKHHDGMFSVFSVSLSKPYLPFKLEHPVATSWTQSPRMRKTPSQNPVKWTSSAKTDESFRSLSPKRIHSPPGSESPGSSCTSCSSSSSSTRGSLALCSRTKDRRICQTALLKSFSFSLGQQ